MGQEFAGESRCASLCRFAGRAAVVAALGTGLWLGGQASATAEELSSSVMTPFAAVDAVPAPSVELLASATPAVAPAVDRTAPVARVVRPAPAAVAPVAAVAVVPAVHSAVVPVTDLADPIVQAAEPVLEVAAPLRDVAAPVVAAVGQAAPLVSEAAVTLAGALDPLLAPIADALDTLRDTGLIGTRERPDPDLHALNQVVHGPAAGPAGAGRGMAPARDDVDPTAGPGGAGGGPGPVPPSTPAIGGPVRVGGTGTSSFDLSPANLPAAVLATITAALAATGDCRDAAGNIASDPSFSPD